MTSPSSGASDAAGEPQPLRPAVRLDELVRDRVTLSVTGPDGQLVQMDLPVLHPTAGPAVIDVRGFYQATGLFMHDPGFTSTSSCTSAITFIDGANGLLLHRGYSIEDLAAHSSYLEVCYLLLNAHLPDNRQMQDFERSMKQHWLLHERLKNFFGGFKDGSHPMAIMCGVVGALAAFVHEQHSEKTEPGRARAAIQIIAKMPTIAAMAYKTSVGEPYVYPKNALSFSENFLRMLFATPCEEYHPAPAFVKAMDLILLLHADHEQNASTSTVRIAGSSDANPFACVAAGIASLWGPMHGGANEAVLQMLDEIGSADRVPLFLGKAKDKTDPFKLMGFGHRVYRNYDPRATEMKKMCHEVVAACQKDDPHLAHFLELALALEAAALADEYFIRRKLFPNVDFYSGITLTAMGIPTSMFTVVFAVARTAGWIAQWKESLDTPGRKISRPRQLYSGLTRRAYPHMLHRSDSIGPHFTDAYLKDNPDTATPLGSARRKRATLEPRAADGGSEGAGLGEWSYFG